MHRPTNLKELIAFLIERPDVIRRSDTAFLPSRETFSGMEGGLMWFLGEDGQRRHIPIDCGMVAHETGLTFGSQGFTVTKFGHTIEFYYADPEQL